MPGTCIGVDTSAELLFPICPSPFSPQAQTVQSLLRNCENFSPQETATIPDTVVIEKGVVALVVVPSPNCPKLLRPKAIMVLLGHTAKECSAPAAINCATVLVGCKLRLPKAANKTM